MKFSGLYTSSYNFGWKEVSAVTITIPQHGYYIIGTYLSIFDLYENNTATRYITVIDHVGYGDNQPPTNLEEVRLAEKINTGNINSKQWIVINACACQYFNATDKLDMYVYFDGFVEKCNVEIWYIRIG